MLYNILSRGLASSSLRNSNASSKKCILNFAWATLSKIQKFPHKETRGKQKNRREIPPVF